MLFGTFHNASRAHHGYRKELRTPLPTIASHLGGQEEFPLAARPSSPDPQLTARSSGERPLRTPH
jgi:hypothetical protein